MIRIDTCSAATAILFYLDFRVSLKFSLERCVGAAFSRDPNAC